MFRITCFATGSSGNCYLISKDNHHFMLECGIPYNDIIIKLAENNLTLNDIDFIAVSHEHKDHALSLEKLKAMNKLVIYQSDYKREINNIIIIPFRVKHDVLCYGFIFLSGSDTLMFATDCEYIEYDLKPLNITQMMIECNYNESILEEKQHNLSFRDLRRVNTHMGLNTTVKTIKAYQTEYLKEIYLMHLSDELSNEKLMRKEISQQTGINPYFCQKKGGIE